MQKTILQSIYNGSFLVSFSYFSTYIWSIKHRLSVRARQENDICFRVVIINHGLFNFLHCVEITLCFMKKCFLQVTQNSDLIENISCKAEEFISKFYIFYEISLLCLFLRVKCLVWSISTKQVTYGLILVTRDKYTPKMKKNELIFFLLQWFLCLVTGIFI